MKHSSTEKLENRNIRAISALEQQALARRSNAQRFSDFIVYQGGRVWTIFFHTAWFGLWIIWNSGWIRGVRPFDPFPFSALTTVVSLEAIFLSLFILVSQNRASRRADERAHLDLQVNLMAEHEATKMLQLLHALCVFHGLREAVDEEVIELAKRTEPAVLARKLEQELPSESGSKQ